MNYSSDSLVGEVVKELSGNLLPYVEVDCRYEIDAINHDSSTQAKVKDPMIESVYTPQLARHIGTSLGSYNELEIYFIERVLVLNKIYNHKFWDISIRGGGKFGEEVGTAKLRTHVAAMVSAQICEVLMLRSLSNRVKYLLTLEYGYMLPSLASRTWSLEKVNKDAMVFRNRNRFERLDRTMVELYKTYPFPRAICILEDSKYRVIDGYHRCAGVGGALSVILGVRKVYTPPMDYGYCG
jgi:hypothetical protein